ncbi:MAG: TolC family protein [Sediminibacterium sp.]|nr:TolC family protein [Sediminibacterium sp.]MBP6144887.1 TolC family protein [Sediminibacterium sp.]
MRNKIIRQSLLLLFLPLSVFAQNTLSISNTFDLIKQFHPIAKQATLKVDMAKASLLSSRGAFDPAFYLNNEQKTFDGKNYFYYSNPELKIPTWYGIEVKAGYENNYGEKLSAETTLGKSSYLGVSVPLLKDLLIDKRRSDLAQSRILVQLSKEEKQLMLNDLYLDGASSYWQWTYAFQKQALFSNIVNNAKSRLEFIKKSFQSGDRAAIDTVEGLLQLQNIMNLQSQASAEQIEEQSKLSNFLWDATQQPYELNESIIPDSNWLTIDLNKITVPSLLQVIEEASLTHPKIKLVEFKTDMLQVERQYKSQNLLPTFRVNYNFLNKGYQFSNPMNQSLYTNNYKAGVQFGLPLFLRQARGDLKQANIKIAQQEEETKQVKLEIENKIKKYYAELIALKNQQLLTNNSVANAKKLLDAEFQRFEIGESSLFLVNSRELKYIEVLLKSYELKSKFFKTLIALNWAKGNLNEL